MNVLKTGRKLSTAMLPLLRVELGILYWFDRRHH